MRQFRIVQNEPHRYSVEVLCFGLFWVSCIDGDFSSLEDARSSVERANFKPRVIDQYTQE